MLRRLLVALAVLLAVVAATSCAASSTTVSPCRQVSVPTWSPDGQQIAFYGKRWPPPTTPHRNPNDILQAVCVMNADGTNAKPLRYTVCSEKCQDPPYQLAWLRSNELLALRDGDVLQFAPGSKPQKAGTINAMSFALDAAGDRLAAGASYPGCTSCAGPVTVLSLPTGKRIGLVGGSKLDNIDPSLSPDGSRVVFERDASNGSGRTFGIWTANADGTGLKRLDAEGLQPLWSPAGQTISFIRPAGSTSALMLQAAGGGSPHPLLSKGVVAVFGWSPDGTWIAYEAGGKLALVDVRTGKVRRLLTLRYAPAVVWSPDSSQLLVKTVPKSQKCWSLTRVPVDGSKPTLISSCNG